MIRKKREENLDNRDYKYIQLSKSSAYFLGSLLLVMTFMGGYFWTKTKNSVTTTPTEKAVVQQPIQPSTQGIVAKPQVSLDTIKSLFTKNVVKFGNGDKKLLIVEVADPSCPFCHVVGGVNTEIGAQMGANFTLKSQGGTYLAPLPEIKKLIDQGKADFVWIYTPGHGNGELATKALYCANDQGKFWQAHDLLLTAKGYDLMNNQIKNDTTKSKQMADFLASAADSGKLKSCIDSGKYDTRLSEDTALATSLGVSGTPGFFVNATNFAGAYSWSDMQSVVDAALK